jgi:hypothetical protein
LSRDADANQEGARAVNLLHAEFYERQRREDLLREAEAERLALLARRTAVRRDPAGGPTPGPRAPRLLGRVLVLVRRATA